MKFVLAAVALVLIAGGFTSMGCSDEACHTESGCETTHASAGGGDGASGATGGDGGDGGDASGGEGGAGGAGGG